MNALKTRRKKSPKVREEPLSLNLDQSEANVPVFPYFSRHETFHPRFGWLKKGFDRVRENPNVFTNDDATVALGVGKNMVRGIRYWSYAFKLTREVGSERQKNKPAFVTDFGTQLLGPKGWDPYLENPSSLWLLHWNLLRPTCYAATWYFVFNYFNHGTFMQEDVLKDLISYKARAFPTTKAQEATLARDINCLFRMYVPQYETNRPDEDTLDSPFSQLDLLRTVGDSKHYVFNVGKKNNLAPEVITAACFDFAAQQPSGIKTISMSRLLYDPGSPGQVFKLPESVLYEAVEKGARSLKDVSISDTAGVVQLVFKEAPGALSIHLLDKYYGSGSKR